MHILIVYSSLAAFLFIKHNKIPMSLDQNIIGSGLFFFYLNAVAVGPDAPGGGSGTFMCACASHVFGIALVVFLLCSLSVSEYLLPCGSLPFAASVSITVPKRRICKKTKLVYQCCSPSFTVSVIYSSYFFFLFFLNRYD